MAMPDPAYPKRNTKPFLGIFFLEDVIKPLILAGLSKLFVPVFYCLLKRK